MENQLHNGMLIAARYAFSPNKLQYCGGDKNSNLFEYVAQNKQNGGLKEILSEFETMYPYLKLIADSSHIADPLDPRVSEAYWIGNDLLSNISMNNFYNYLIDKQNLKKKFKMKLVEKVIGKIPVGAKPHHSFHVLNIPKRTGYYPVEHTLETINECLILPAKVLKIKQGKLEVKYKPLIFKDNKLVFGALENKDIHFEFNNKKFIKNIKIGEYVSMHWSWACDKLSALQVMDLNKWNGYSVGLANL
jgi:hypothetical protein